MYLATRYAICFAAISTEATDTFMFLPSWNNDDHMFLCIAQLQIPAPIKFWAPYH